MGKKLDVPRFDMDWDRLLMMVLLSTDMVADAIDNEGSRAALLYQLELKQDAFLALVAENIDVIKSMIANEQKRRVELDSFLITRS